MSELILQRDLQEILQKHPHNLTVENVKAIKELMASWDGSLGLQESYSWDPEMCEPEPHLSSKPHSLLQDAEYLICQRGLRPESTLLCDLGSGYGFPLAVYAALGFRAYGVEQHAGLADLSRRRLAEAGKIHPFPHLPQVVTADCLHAENIRFPDGRSFEDMDVFYLYCSSEEWITDVMERLPCRPGALLVLPPVDARIIRSERFSFLDDDWTRIVSYAQRIPTSSSGSASSLPA